MTVEPLTSPSASAIRTRAASSTRKFCPSFGLRFIRSAASILSCASAVAPQVQLKEIPIKGISTVQVELLDTSLRDGLQQPNLEISVPNAARLLQRMGAFGVHYAEIGFAGANQFVSDLADALENVDTGATRLALFGRSRGRGRKVQDWPDLKSMVAHKSRIPVSVIVVKSRLLDVVKSLETTREENLQ